MTNLFKPTLIIKIVEYEVVLVMKWHWHCVSCLIR